MRKKSCLFFATAVSLALMASLSSCQFSASSLVSSSSISVSKDSAAAKVHSVEIDYNNEMVSGTLSMDVSSKTIQVSAKVNKDEGAQGTLSYGSTKQEVATIDSQGLITLLKKGETVISASFGEISTQFVLVVTDTYTAPVSYTIAVTGGHADKVKALAGEYVTLTADIPLHKDYVRWDFSLSDIWQNGNVFKMPAANVSVTGIYEDMLYTLNIIGAKVTKDADEAPKSGSVTGNTHSGNDKIYDIMTYTYAYNTPLTVDAVTVPSGMMFIGWDFGVENHRVGETGNTQYGPFLMPDDTLTVWAIFSPLQSQVFTAGSVGSGYYNAGKGAASIKNGAINGTLDPDLQGLNGYRLTISGTTIAQSDFPENITGSTLDTTGSGSQTMKAIFKNRHATLPVTVEIYCTYYGNLCKSGLVTVPANSTIIQYFDAGLGINNPWMGFCVRKNVGGTSTDMVLLDMVLGCAPTYPNGDKSLSVSGKAEYVALSGYTAGGSWSSSRPRIVNNAVGTSSIAIYGGNFGGVVNGYLSSLISNMPAYDVKNPKTTIYGKLINNVNNVEEPLGTFDFSVGTDSNPVSGTAGSSMAKTEVVIKKVGQMDLFALTFTRTAADNGNFYFGIIKPVIDNEGTLWGHNFCVQLTYNNVMGYKEA